MKTNKAAGTDGIPVEFYKYCGDILSQPLTTLFNHVMNTSSYPGAWCEGVINPLHKRESPALPENYRKITVTPAIGKIFDHRGEAMYISLIDFQWTCTETKSFQ